LNRTIDFRDGWWHQDSSQISGAAALLSGVIYNDDNLKDDLVSWLTGTSGGGTGESISIRRVVLAVLARDEG
jgi:hypothetical protein